MLSRRVFTRSVSSLLAAGVFMQLLTPAAGARSVTMDVAAPEPLPEDDQDDEAEPQDPEEPQDGGTQDAGTTEGTSTDSGQQLGLNKATITPDPSLIASHDNGKHHGLVKQRADDKVRGVGFWANLTKKTQGTNQNK